MANYPSTNGAPYHPGPNDLLNVLDIAAALRISRKTAYQLVKSGAIKSLRLSERGIRVTRRALDTYIANQQAQADKPLLDRAKLLRAGRIR